MIAWLPEWIVIALKALGLIAAFIAFGFFVAAAVLIIWFKRKPPEDWS